MTTSDGSSVRTVVYSKMSSIWTLPPLTLMIASVTGLILLSDYFFSRNFRSMSPKPGY